MVNPNRTVSFSKFSLFSSFCICWSEPSRFRYFWFVRWPFLTFESLKFSASVDNTLRDLQNSSYPTKAELNNCFIIRSRYFFAFTCKLYSRPFLFLLNDTTLCPSFLGQWFNNLWRQWFNNLQRAPLLTSFWRQWCNNLQRTALLTSLVQYDRIFGQQQLFMVNYACGFSQSEMGKYFEWIINPNISIFPT